MRAVKAVAEFDFIIRSPNRAETAEGGGGAIRAGGETSGASEMSSSLPASLPLGRGECDGGEGDGDGCCDDCCLCCQGGAPCAVDALSCNCCSCSRMAATTRCCCGAGVGEGEGEDDAAAAVAAEEAPASADADAAAAPPLKPSACLRPVATAAANAAALADREVLFDDAPLPPPPLLLPPNSTEGIAANAPWPDAGGEELRLAWLWL